MNSNKLSNHKFCETAHGCRLSIGLNNVRLLNSSDGYTLIEAMVTVGIIIILSALLIPQFSGVQERYRLRSAARAAYSDLQLAKSTAIKEGSQCVVQFNSSGYSVFLDINENFTQDAGTDIVIKTVNWSDFSGVTLGTVTLNSNMIGFRPDGTTRSSGGGFGAGSITLNADGRQLQVIVNITGSVRIQ